jgi:1,4-alpha-glucan branching enzyme
VRFALWAPHARAAYVTGDFNGWDAGRHPLRRQGDSGVWETFIPGVTEGAHYRFVVRPPAEAGGPTAPGAAPSLPDALVRADPYARQFYAPGSSTAVVVGDRAYPWEDEAWMSARRGRDWSREPVAIYEVDLASWARGQDGQVLGCRDLAERLVAHAQGLGFTHLELLPVTEHDPLGEGRYAAGGLFAPTARLGSADDFRYLVDYCHRHGVGVFVDWPAAQIASGPAGLAAFDGRPLYERAVTAEGSPLPTFDFARGGVRSLLLSSGLFWLTELHVDGLRMPSMSSVLYLDHARAAGQWTPNRYGGNENLEAIAFLRELSDTVAAVAPGALLIAEESSGWPQVTRPPWVGGLGFGLRWNRGWMQDTLEYLQKDPVYRHYHHDLLTFSLLYAFQERHVLPLSHEEVTLARGPLLNRMPGDRWQQLASVRLLYTYLWTQPGKKLLFMGGEYGFPSAWDPEAAIEHSLQRQPAHAGIAALVRDLNHVYRASPALHRQELSQKGFEWVDKHDAPQSIIAYLRRDGDDLLVVALNFTPVPRQQYRIGVPFPGSYLEVLNSDSAYYGGSNLGNLGDLRTEPVPWMGRPYSLSIMLPPLAGVVLKPVGG